MDPKLKMKKLQISNFPPVGSYSSQESWERLLDTHLLLDIRLRQGFSKKVFGDPNPQIG